MSFVNPEQAFMKFNNDKKLQEEKNKDDADEKLEINVNEALTNSNIWAFNGSGNSSIQRTSDLDVWINAGMARPSKINDMIALAKSKNWNANKKLNNYQLGIQISYPKTFDFSRARLGLLNNSDQQPRIDRENQQLSEIINMLNQFRTQHAENYEDQNALIVRESENTRQLLKKKWWKKFFSC